MEKKGYVLITGGGSGLGKSLALQFAKRKFLVVLVGRTKSKLDAVSKECGKNYSLAIEADVSKRANVERCFHLANEWAGFPLLAFSCAGEGIYGKVGSFSDIQLERVMSGALFGTILVAQKAFLEMKNKGGTIVNILSTAAISCKVNESIYCAAKWGAKGFTESLRLEAKGTKVKVIAVYPGGLQTQFGNLNGVMKTDTSGFINPDELAQTIIENVLNKHSLYVADIIINRIYKAY